jgi:Delta6-protoilludene synthase
MTAPSTETYFILPDLLENWPFDHEPNPHDDVVQDSARWAESYRVFDKKAQAFNRCNVGYYSSLAYPCAEAKGGHFRVVCDLMNLFFVFNELTNEATGKIARQQAADVMNALRSVTVLYDRRYCLIFNFY